MNAKKCRRRRHGDKTVNNAVNATPSPKIVTPPNLRARIPPSGPNKYPMKNTLRTNSWVFESQLKSAAYKKKSLKHGLKN